ncbi:hypothetical protein HanXRQr2_Chr09g0376181 [Helianthus annuus]|uniref:Uncharacterized protein n=1 Tax=Helianthus annuus TaxID=4232 RepID=A0A9K3I4D6_HELAN|nr:hypothetical protein HanXRQr2_Chr09g0376181 [Helianthus annuus]KAJ0892170.1 hypothetical protein HanPSC8_Chr09g0362741 [Helianthus annuus]
MLTYFHMCFRYSSWCYMMMILVYARIGMDEALVTLKDARLVKFCFTSCLLRHCNSFKSIKQHFNFPCVMKQ